MRNMWHLWPAFLDDETCDAIVREAATLPSKDGDVGGLGEARVDHSIRSALVSWVDPLHPDWAEVVREIEGKFIAANRETFGFETSSVPADIQIGTYHAERQGHFKWHRDAWFHLPHKSPLERKLTMIIQLTCPRTYEGGDLELDAYERPDPRALRQRGSILVFPSFVHHRVTPVTHGTRQSLVAWKDGPAWR